MKRLNSIPFYPFFILILAPLILLAPVYALGKALFWGTPLLQFIPWWVYAWEAILAGNIPWWNAQVGMGAPLLANYQSALFYPPNAFYFMLYIIGKAPLMAWGQALVVALHLAWAGVGMALLVRRLGLSPFSQAISGLAFSLSGYLVGRAGFLSINAAVAWLPWLLICLTPTKDRQFFKMDRFLWLVFCLALQLLAGHAQTTFYSLVLAGIWGAYWGWNSIEKETDFHTSGKYPAWQSRFWRLLRTWGWLALAMLLAFGLAAVQLVPTAEYLAQSQRASAADYEFVVTYSFWPWHLVNLIAPGMFGSPVTGDYWGYANYWEDAVYIGLLPLLLALGALFSSLRRKRRLPGPPEFSEPLVLGARFTWFLGCLALLALLLALGKNTPLFPWLYFHVPTFDMFQAPARMMIWTVFALPLLAGIGAQRWRRPEGRGLYWSRLATMGAFAVTVGAGLAWMAMGEISPSFIRATALSGFWGLGTGLLNLTAPPDNGRPTNGRTSEDARTPWHGAVLLFVALDLLVAGWGLNPGVDRQLYQPIPNAAQIRSQAAGGRLYISEADERELKFERFLRFDTFHSVKDWGELRQSLLPNQHLLDGLSSANNFDPLVPGRFARWMAFLSKVDSGYRERLLDLMGVTLWQQVDPQQPGGIRFNPLEGGSRARWVGCALSVAGEQQAWDLVAAGQLDFDRQVVLETGVPSPAEACPPAGPAQVRIESEPPAQVVLQVQSPQSGWLVLSDSWYPGWRATLDGEVVQIMPANYLFRAVAVPAGTHQVVFRYRPYSFLLGGGASLLAGLWWVGLWVWLWRRRRVESEPRRGGGAR